MLNRLIMRVFVHWSVPEGMKEGKFVDLAALENYYEESEWKLLRVKEKKKRSRVTYVTCHTHIAHNYSTSSLNKHIFTKHNTTYTITHTLYIYIYILYIISINN